MKGAFVLQAMYKLNNAGRVIVGAGLNGKAQVAREG